MSDLNEVREKRMAVMLNTMGVGRFGSLYFVPEEIWKRGAGKRYDQHSKRRGHPGCSIRKDGVMQSLEPVPMLLGSSRKRNNTVKVENVTGDGRSTFLGSLPPIPVSYRSWTKNVKPKIRPIYKRMLSSDEQVELMELCVRKGWL